MEQIEKEEGFTLLELLLSVTILALFLAPMLGFFVNSTELTNQSDFREQALFLAQEKMEKLKTERFGLVYSNLNEDSNYYDDSPSLSGNYPEYTRDVTIERLDDPGDTQNRMKITVTVSWEPGQSVTLKTIMIRRR